MTGSMKSVPVGMGVPVWKTVGEPCVTVVVRGTKKPGPVGRVCGGWPTLMKFGVKEVVPVLPSGTNVPGVVGNGCGVWPTLTKLAENELGASRDSNPSTLGLNLTLARIVVILTKKTGVVSLPART